MLEYSALTRDAEVGRTSDNDVFEPPARAR
jgi:hypothetical protein